jgi:hypothetical protein
VWVLGFDSWRGLGIFLFTTASRTVLGPTQPLIQWVPGSLTLGVKLPGREADHSRSSAEVKECMELYLHFPISLHDVVLSEAQGQLYVTFTWSDSEAKTYCTSAVQRLACIWSLYIFWRKVSKLKRCTEALPHNPEPVKRRKLWDVTDLPFHASALNCQSDWNSKRIDMLIVVVHTRLFTLSQENRCISQGVDLPSQSWFLCY